MNHLNKVAKGSTPSRFYLHPKGESLPEAEYEKLVYQLKVEFTEKSHSKSKTMKSLMDDTFTTWRKWIVDEQPKVVEVLAKFLFLNLERWVSLNTDLHVHPYADVHVHVYSYLYMYVYTENISVQVHFVTHIETQLFYFVILNIVKTRVQGDNEYRRGFRFSGRVDNQVAAHYTGIHRKKGFIKHCTQN